MKRNRVANPEFHHLCKSRPILPQRFFFYKDFQLFLYLFLCFAESYAKLFQFQGSHKQPLPAAPTLTFFPQSLASPATLFSPAILAGNSPFWKILRSKFYLYFSSRESPPDSPFPPSSDMPAQAFHLPSPDIFHRFPALRKAHPAQAPPESPPPERWFQPEPLY